MQFGDFHREVDAFIKTITYKPEYRITTRDMMSSDALSVFITCLVRDADGISKDPVRITVQQTLTLTHWEELSKKDRIKTFYLWILGLETHEIREWFKVSGEKVYDPHKPEVE